MSLARSAVILFALILSLPTSGLVAAADTKAPAETKKVETERITVDPTTVPANVDIHKGVEGLPPKVLETRKRILEAAYSGDMDKLKSVIQQNELPPIFSVNEITDPIDYLKTQSGDGEGLEILAIMTQILEAGWAHVDAGKPSEMYVWPYFATVPVDKLENSQMVELYKIITSADYEEMKSSGKYSFYTFGIGVDGTWHYFKLND